METNLILMDAERIRRSVKRMAYEIMEKNREDKPVFLFGIDHRGFALSQLLEEILNEISGGRVRTVQLPVKKDVSGEDFEKLASVEVADCMPIVVDDVIFSGQTMFKALSRISDSLEPEEIHTAVLVDRGHRKFPILAEFYGMELPTKLNEHVSVSVDNMEVEGVTLQKV